MPEKMTVEQLKEAAALRRAASTFVEGLRTAGWRSYRDVLEHLEGIYHDHAGDREERRIYKEVAQLIRRELAKF